MGHPPRRARRLPAGPAGRARARPTRLPRGRAPAVRGGATALPLPRARAPRSAPTGPAPRVLRPCLEGRRQLVTCLCRLAGALLETCDRVGDAEQCFVELPYERAPVAVQEDADEEAPQQLGARLTQL